MPADVILLKTFADCDEATTTLGDELDMYQNKDQNLDYADRRDGRVVASVTGQLAGVNAKIDAYTATLTQPNLPADERENTELLKMGAEYQRARLTRSAKTRTGASAFLADVDADQVEGQVTILTTTRARVVTHRATLTA